MRIKIITDSTADIPRELVNKYEIEVLPLIVNFETGSFIDGVEITPEGFYEKMRNSKKLPTTSQVPIAVFHESFEKNIKAYDIVIGIFLSNSLSGTFQSAAMVAAELESDKLFLVDSGQVTMALGLMVMEAARLNKAGRPYEDILQHLDYLKKKIKLRAVIGNLENLKKGGRLSPASAMIGTALNIKPIIETKNGLVDVLHKTRGEKNAVKWIIKTLEKEVDENYPVVAGHSNSIEKCLEMINAIKEELDISIETISMLGAVVGTHAGEGCFGVAYISK